VHFDNVEARRGERGDEFRQIVSLCPPRGLLPYPHDPENLHQNHRSDCDGKEYPDGFQDFKTATPTAGVIFPSSITLLMRSSCRAWIAADGGGCGGSKPFSLSSNS
jgi:hypothetical protein